MVWTTHRLATNRLRSNCRMCRRGDIRVILVLRPVLLPGKGRDRGKVGLGWVWVWDRLGWGASILLSNNMLSSSRVLWAAMGFLAVVGTEGVIRAGILEEEDQVVGMGSRWG